MQSQVTDKVADLRLKCRFATLMDKFRWTPEQMAGLTPRQVAELCFHKRNKHGVVTLDDDIPAGDFQSLEQEIATLEAFAKTLNGDTNLEAAKATALRKWGRDERDG